MRTIHKFQLVAFVVICIIIVGFSGTKTALGTEEKLKVAVITLKPEGFHNAFWDALQMGARKAGEELGVDIFYAGIPAEYESNRVDGQTAVMKKFVEQGVDGIVFTPCDRIGMVRAVKDAVIKGVQVVAIDSPIESNLPSSVLATNNYGGSLLAAKHMAKLLGGQGEVIMLCHPARENKATRDRELALVAGLKQYAPEVKLVSVEQCGGATIETDYPAAKKLLEQFPDVDGVYAVSGTGIIGFMMALQELDKAGQVKLIGWDAGPDAVQGLRDGIVHAIVQQNPEKMGYGGVKAVVAAIKGEEVKRMVDTGVAIVTKENMDDPEIKQLIEPDFGDWIK